MGKVLFQLICVLAASGCSVIRYCDWNEDDARITARELAYEVLAANRLRVLSAASKRTPVLGFDTWGCDSANKVDLQELKNELTRELLASGKVRMVLLRDDSSVSTDSLSLTEMSIPIEERGADMLLQGKVVVAEDSVARTYKLELKLIDARSKEVLHTMTVRRIKPPLSDTDTKT